MLQPTLDSAIQRIAEMESLFDDLLRAYEQNPEAFLYDDVLRSRLDLLLEYYEGGQWLADYALDEQGLLPDTLKRGVLSEDGVYNFLSGLDV